MANLKQQTGGKLPAGVSPIAAGRLKLTNSHPYYSSMLFAFVPVKVENLFEQAGGPIAVDKHMRLYYDEPWLMECSVEEIATLLAHELGHVMRGHHSRAESFAAANGFPLELNHHLINCCEDAEINDDLREENFVFPKNPKTGKPSVVFPEKLPTPCKPGDVWENYFLAQPKGPNVSGGSGEGEEGGEGENQNGNSGKLPEHSDCGSMATGGSRPWEVPGDDKDTPKVSPVEQEMISRQVARDIQEFASQEKNRGKVPAGLRRWAEQKLKIKYDPRRELMSAVRYAVMEQAGMVNYTWKKFARRTPEGFYLPGLSAPIPDVIVGIDSSGSMGEGAIAKALQLVRSTLKALGSNIALRVLSCDAQATPAKKIFRTEQVDVLGGGGTDMRIIFDAVSNMKPRANIFILVTDCETPWPKESIGIKTIVAAVETKQRAVDSVPSWAKVIWLDKE